MSRTRQARSIAAARPRGGEAAPAGEVRVVQGNVATNEQRSGPRRRPRSDRAAALPAGSAAGRNWIPPRWPYLILTMLAAIGSAMVAARGVLEPLVGAMLAAAVIAVALVGPAHAFVANRHLWPRLAA